MHIDLEDIFGYFTNLSDFFKIEFCFGGGIVNGQYC